MRNDFDILTKGVGVSDEVAKEIIRHYQATLAKKDGVQRRLSAEAKAARATEDALQSRPYKEPSIENIALNVPYLESRFGSQGLGKQLPESQGSSYGWTGRYSGWPGKFASVQERLEKCKIMVTYFVRCEGTNFIKIGQSNRVGKRLSNLQSDNPHPLELSLILPNVMGFREEDMHYRFGGLRERGEWFRNEGSLQQFLAAKIAIRQGPMDLSLRPTSEDLRAAQCG